MQGIVLKSTGSWYEVRLASGDVVSCRLKGKIRLLELNTTNPIAVGDLVDIENEDTEIVISKIHDRKNYIVRESPKKKYARHIIAANVDQLFLIVTIASPRTSTGFIDRFLMTAEAYHIPASIIINKQDTYDEKALEKQAEMLEIYEPIGYPCHLISALDSNHVKFLEDLLQNKITLFSGHSGVGKSTLINALDPLLDLRVGEISNKHDKGIHTTTFAEMIILNNDTYIIDTPGIKEFGIMNFELEEIGQYFREFKAVMNDCQFNNCLHLEEPNCAVKNAMEQGKIHPERYFNYVSILEGYKENFNYWERKS